MYGLHRVPYSRVVPCLGVRVLRLRNSLVNSVLLTAVYFIYLLYLIQRDDEHKKVLHVYTQQHFK